MDIMAFLDSTKGEGRDNYIDTKTAAWQEITEYCEKNDQVWCVSGNGVHYLRKMFWCRHDKVGPNGERPCSICGPYSEWSREREIRDKLAIAYASSSTLYMTRTVDEDETKKLVYRLKRKGGKYLSIPSNENGGKLFLMDVYDKMSNPVATGLQEAANSFMPLRNNTEWGYFSGGLGKEPTEDDNDSISYTIPSRLNVTVPKELMSGVETEAVLSVGIERITKENAEVAVKRKLALVEEILQECGFPDAKHTGEKVINISLSKLQQTWFAAKIIPVSVTDLEVYPVAMAMEIKQTVNDGLDALKKRNRSYMTENPPDDDDGLDSLGIIW